MRRDEVLRLLSEHRAELEQAGVLSLACFGSVARDEAGEDSDIDFLVEFTEPPGFLQFMNLKFFLEDLLGCRVDLVTHKALKPRLRPVVEREVVNVPGF
ncbi:MAG: nucleotidyltransferase family protein [Chloroflexi bacterium]|nr:nucleotidyltransferase family protein [Chloroflexota bacterium]